MARHLKKEERDRIAQLTHQGYQQKEIASKIERSQPTICRELKRIRAEKTKGIDPETLKQISVFDPEDLKISDPKSDSTENR